MSEDSSLTAAIDWLAEHYKGWRFARGTARLIPGEKACARTRLICDVEIVRGSVWTPQPYDIHVMGSASSYLEAVKLAMGLLP